MGPYSEMARGEYIRIIHVQDLLVSTKWCLRFLTGLLGAAGWRVSNLRFHRRTGERGSWKIQEPCWESPCWYMLTSLESARFPGLFGVVCVFVLGRLSGASRKVGEGFHLWI